MKKYFLRYDGETIQEALIAHEYGPYDTLKEAEKWKDDDSTIYVIQPHKESENGNGTKILCESELYEYVSGK